MFKLDNTSLQTTESHIAIAPTKEFKTISHAGFSHYELCILASLLVLSLVYQRNVNRRSKRYSTDLDALRAVVRDTQERLDELQSQVDEKERDLEQLVTSIEKSSKTEESTNYNGIQMEELLLRPILTEEDWVNFQKSFDEIYPGVIDRMQNDYSNLTQADLRYLVLAYLNLTHKEMAALLAISADSLRVSWHRLRKKLNLSSDVCAFEFIEIYKQNSTPLATAQPQLVKL